MAFIDLKLEQGSGRDPCIIWVNTQHIQSIRRPPFGSGYSDRLCTVMLSYGEIITVHASMPKLIRRIQQADMSYPDSIALLESEIEENNA